MNLYWICMDKNTVIQVTVSDLAIMFGVQGLEPQSAKDRLRPAASQMPMLKS